MNLCIQGTLHTNMLGWGSRLFSSFLGGNQAAFFSVTPCSSSNAEDPAVETHIPSKAKFCPIHISPPFFFCLHVFLDGFFVFQQNDWCGYPYTCNDSGQSDICSWDFVQQIF